MKYFYMWYLVSSIIGVWSLMAYIFYRISQISYGVSLLTSRVSADGEIQFKVKMETRGGISKLEKEIGALEDNQAKIHDLIICEISNRRDSCDKILGDIGAVKAYIDEHINGKHKDLSDDLRTLEECFNKNAIPNIEEKTND